MKTESLTHLRDFIVVARQEGLRLGSVSEAFIHADSRKLATLAIKSGLADAERFVAFADIELIGEDVVLVSSVSATREDLGTPEQAGRAFRDLRGMPIATAGGRALGKLADIDVNNEDGVITDLFLTDGNAIAVSANDVTLGRDQIILPAGYEGRVSEPSEDRRSFLSKLLSKDTVDEVATSLKRAFKPNGTTAAAQESRPAPGDTPSDRIEDKSDQT
jgi:sporulation protein YlmC with PRC-barrel domain